MAEQDVQRVDHLHAESAGLTHEEAARRLAEIGPNTLPERKRSRWVVLLSYLWGLCPG